MRYLSKPLYEFVFYTFLFSWLMWLPNFLYTLGILKYGASFMQASEYMKWIGGIGPSFVAFILTYRDNGSIGTKSLVKRVFRFKLGLWYLPTILLIPILLILAYLLKIIVAGSEFPITPLLAKPWWIPLIFLSYFIIQMGEEYGWRGYALNKLLETKDELVSSLILGTIWAVWHIPMFLSQGFHEYENALPFCQFLISLVLLSIIITWIYNNTKGSLLAAFVIHTQMNMSSEILPLYMKNGGKVEYTIWVCFNLMLFGICVFIVKAWRDKYHLDQHN